VDERKMSGSGGLGWSLCRKTTVSCDEQGVLNLWWEMEDDEPGRESWRRREEEGRHR
jgi:hypothetical protein